MFSTDLSIGSTGKSASGTFKFIPGALNFGILVIEGYLILSLALSVSVSVS